LRRVVLYQATKSKNRMSVHDSVSNTAQKNEQTHPVDAAWCTAGLGWVSTDPMLALMMIQQNEFVDRINEDRIGLQKTNKGESKTNRRRKMRIK
jgi:hypothetical protein